MTLILNHEQQATFCDCLKVEQALKAKKARYQAIVEDKTELICLYRQDFTISYVNDAFCRYFDLEFCG